MKRIVLGLLLVCCLAVGGTQPSGLWFVVKQTRWVTISTTAETKFKGYCDSSVKTVFSWEWSLQDAGSNTWGNTCFGGDAIVLKKSGDPITPAKLQTWYNGLAPAIRADFNYMWGTRTEFTNWVDTNMNLTWTPAPPIE